MHELLSQKQREIQIRSAGLLQSGGGGPVQVMCELRKVGVAVWYKFREAGIKRCRLHAYLCVSIEKLGKEYAAAPGLQELRIMAR